MTLWKDVCLFQNRLVTHSGQNRLDYGESDTQKPDLYLLTQNRDSTCCAF